MKCLLCKKDLNTGNIEDKDCGGDCLACMAREGDPDCIEELIMALEELHMDKPTLTEILKKDS